LSIFKFSPESFKFALKALEGGESLFISPFSGVEESSFDTLFPMQSLFGVNLNLVSPNSCKIFEIEIDGEYTPELFSSRDPGYITRIRNLSWTPGRLPVLYGVKFKEGEEVWICEKPGEVRKIYSTRS